MSTSALVAGQHNSDAHSSSHHTRTGSKCHNSAVICVTQPRGKRHRCHAQNPNSLPTTPPQASYNNWQQHRNVRYRGIHARISVRLLPSRQSRQAPLVVATESSTDALGGLLVAALTGNGVEVSPRSFASRIALMLSSVLRVATDEQAASSFVHGTLPP